ncbi:MAG: protein kinase [Phycisphaera sp.]|nr:protein kinase [Phycisphaera sp.]
MATQSSKTSRPDDSWANQKTQIPIDSDFEATPEVPGYELREVIGRGGQAIVFLAIQQATDKRVAVKVLRSGPIFSSADLARFRRESNILASLDHPAIVGVIETGRTPQGQFFLVMDYVPGKQLDHYLGTSLDNPLGPLTIDYKLRLMKRIADAVEVAHARGIMHRDLKPSNILIDDSGNPHILDFGLARHAKQRAAGDGMIEDDMTMTGQFVGTMPWASPEQVRGNTNTVDIRSDVYTLGIVLYRMLTGAFPYVVHGDMPDVLRNITEAIPTPMNEALNASRPDKSRKHSFLRFEWREPRPDIEPTIEAITLKALAKSPEHRYLTAGDLARDLHSYLSGKPTVATGFAERLGLIRVMKVAIVAAVFASIVAMFSLAVASGWFDPEVREAAAVVVAADPPAPETTTNPRVPRVAAPLLSTRLNPASINLLNLVQPRRHAQSGEWGYEGDGLFAEAPDKLQAELVVPMIVRDNYDVSVTFQRSAGEDGIAVYLPLGGDRGVALVVGGYPGQIAGLSRIKRLPANHADNPTRHDYALDNTAHTLVITVDTHRKSRAVHISATIDDEPIVDWSGPANTLDTDYFRARSNPAWREAVGLIAMPNTTYHFDRVSIEQR